MVGKLEIVDLREIWKHEAYDFTAWLFENLDVLNEQPGISVSGLEKEKSVGPSMQISWLKIPKREP